jgi:hypothetical protein
MNTRTPENISADVTKLCREISPTAMPIFVPITPEPGCNVNDCFHNVRRKVERGGGRIQFGWSIWEWPRVYVEAEHHAVYEPPAGPPWIDITPCAYPGNKRRLFLPDDTAIYDYENEGVRKDNRRLAIVNDPLVQEFFRLAQEHNEILNTVPGIGLVTLEGDAALRYQCNRQQHALIEYQLNMKYTPQGAACFCGSGQKFKRCHGEPRYRET